MPAETPVVVPIDISNTPQIADRGSSIPWVKLEYTPNVTSTNFALMVSSLDSPPNNAQQPPNDVAPMYLNVKWVGTFSGAHSPGTTGFYQQPPTFTFAISDAWATKKSLTRDSNCVPIISLSLLDNATGAWTRVNTIDRPAGATSDGQYVYTAHLEHFSDYVITANTASPAGGVGSSARGRSPPVSVSARLTDSITIGDSPQRQATEVIEEFVKNKSMTVRLLSDELRFATKPVAYHTTLLAGSGVTVGMTVDSVKTEEGIFGKAMAKVLFRLENSGSRPEQFVLNYFYIDETGSKAYESSKTVEIGPGELKHEEARIPFSKPGAYHLVMEARSIDGSAVIGFVQSDVQVPWLAVNMYLMITIAVAILAALVVVLTLFMSRLSK